MEDKRNKKSCQKKLPAFRLKKEFQKYKEFQRYASQRERLFNKANELLDKRIMGEYHSTKRAIIELDNKYKKCASLIFRST